MNFVMGNVCNRLDRLEKRGNEAGTMMCIMGITIYLVKPNLIYKKIQMAQ